MASNSFGTLFRITTFGESHGLYMGVVIDGVPAGLDLTQEDIQLEVDKRAPGKTPYTTTRIEKDQIEIISGLYEGKTTGAPIAILIKNTNTRKSSYEPIKDLFRPGHANYSYLQKYGIYDYRGGGRASARETVCRVAAGAVAKKYLKYYQIFPIAYVLEIGGIKAQETPSDYPSLFKSVNKSPIFCPDQEASEEMSANLLKVKEQGDSLGGVIEGKVFGLSCGLGDPVYEKIEAKLAAAMLSIPASKGFELGCGFQAASMRGSEHNDSFIKKEGQLAFETNHSGGALGGISTGAPLFFKVAFKPTSSIMAPQKTLDIKYEEKEFALPKNSRHDPCVAIRAAPVVEAMSALVLADLHLLNKISKL